MPASLEAEWKYWDDKATELRRNQLTTVQTAATKWSALLTALLGVFGGVAFAGGLTTIDKLDAPYDVVVKMITTAAVVSDVLAIYFLTKAAGGIFVRRVRGFSASTVRDMNTTGAKDTLASLNTGKEWALTAAALVLIGSALVLWVGEKADKPKAPSVVAVVDAQLICGPLGRDASGTITIGGMPASKPKLLVTVAACP